MTTGKDSLSPLFKEHLSDFDYCEAIIKEQSKSFYSAFSRLPREKALSVYAIYAFCRTADDSIDIYHDKNRLAQLKQELTEFQAGKVPDKPIWRALNVVFRTYPMDVVPFYEMLEGQEMDIDFQQPQTQKELEAYCYYVAGTVGMMLLPLLSKKADSIREQAKSLGTAMQLTNILRDVGEDYEADRIYFPTQEMAANQLTEIELARAKISSNFIALWEFEAQRAEELYEFSLTMLPVIDADCREPLLLALYLYRDILAVIRENDYECFTQRHYVPKERRLLLYYQVKKALKKLSKNS